MKSEQRNLIPVLLGADLNAYSVALSFREAYGVRSHVFARYECGETQNSEFITTHICKGLDSPSVAIPALLKFADENNGAELFLIPCADWYVEMLEWARIQLGGIYHIFIPERELFMALSDKVSFYSIMKKSAIPYPPCISISNGECLSEKKFEKIGMPCVIKPSDSSEYWRNRFPGMKKVYFPENYSEAVEIIKKIFDSGYMKSIILQKKIENENGNRVLTTVSDSRGRVVRAVYGEVILEENGITSLGNHSAIITQPLNDICFQLIDFLTKQRYIGIANFDLIASAHMEYVLELNPRQGRSCDYLRAAGVNIAELIVKSSNGESVAPDFSYKQVYWHHPPHKTVLNFASAKNAQTAERLSRSGREFCPYMNEYEGVGRKLYLFVHNFRLKNKFKKNQNGSTK